MVDLNIKENNNNVIAEYQLKNGDRIDNLTLGMLMNNRIEGVIPVSPVQAENEQSFRYDITGMVSLKEYLGEYVKRDSILKAFYEIAVSIRESTEYMINWTSFLLDKKKIYVNQRTGKVGLICLPILSVVNDGNTCNFFKNILFSAQFDLDENGDYVGKLITFLNPRTYTLEKFIYELEDMLGMEHRVYELEVEDDEPAEEVSKAEAQSETGEAEAQSEADKQSEAGEAEAGEVDKQSETGEAEAQSEADKQSEAGEADNQSEVDEVSETVEKQAVQETEELQESVEPETESEESQESTEPETDSEASQAEAAEENETSEEELIAEIIDVEDEEPVSQIINLEDKEPVSQTINAEDKPFLLRISNNEKIYIDKDRFVIGKDAEKADYCITGIPAISAEHAFIIREGNEYILVDNNSENHSYMNRVLISPDEEVYIPHKAHLRFADEDFEFRMHE